MKQIHYVHSNILSNFFQDQFVVLYMAIAEVCANQCLDYDFGWTWLGFIIFFLILCTHAALTSAFQSVSNSWHRPHCTVLRTYCTRTPVNHLYHTDGLFAGLHNKIHIRNEPFSVSDGSVVRRIRRGTYIFLY